MRANVRRNDLEVVNMPLYKNVRKSDQLYRGVGRYLESEFSEVKIPAFDFIWVRIYATCFFNAEEK